MLFFIWFFFLRIFLPIIIFEIIVVTICHRSDGIWKWKNNIHFFLLFLLFSIVIGIQFPNSFFLSLIILFIYLGYQFTLLDSFSLYYKLSVSIISVFVLFFILVIMVFSGIPKMNYSYTEFTQGKDKYHLIMRQAEMSSFAVQRTENTLYIYKNNNIFPVDTDKQFFNSLYFGLSEIPDSYDQLTDYLNKSKNE